MELNRRVERPLIYATAMLGVAVGVFAVAGFGQRLAAWADQIPICINSTPSDNRNESAFLAANLGAMTRMMAEMKIEPAGDVDHDFVAMMVPHHQGAIEMAQAELRYGRDERLKRMAQEIIVTQQQEIAAMRLALGQPLPPSTAAPDQISSSETIAKKPN